MVLFKLNIWKSYLCTCKIYIPLWSYSNLRATTPLVINKVFTFHYGPIQITTPKRITNGNTIIYIPLWSYSNMPGLLKILQTLQIYIPLWSYSNLASIKVATMYWKFTFHYGPIQILKEKIYLTYLLNLHSTMVLFKLYLL